MAVTSANTWKKTRTVELSLPSGNTCLARSVDLAALIKSGRVPNSLMPIMKNAMAGKATDISKLDPDDQMISEMMDMMDIILLDVVIQPKVHPVPKPVLDDDGNVVSLPERDDDVLYVDDVDLTDKQFVFQWAVGGTSSVEKFLERSSEYLASLSSGGDVEQDSK